MRLTPLFLRERDITTGGMRLHCVEAGEGPNVFLIHGLFACSAIWEPLARQLSQEFHVVSIDLPGHGKSQYIPDDMSPVQSSLLVYEMANELLHGRAVFVAHSLGCRILLDVLNEIQASGLILLSPYLGSLERLSWLSPVVVRSRGSVGKRRIGATGFVEVFKRLVREPDNVDLSFLERIVSPLGHGEKTEELTRWVAAFMRMGSLDLTSLSPPSFPVVVADGMDDPLLDTEFHERLVGHLGAESVLFQECGHFPQIEVPGEVASLVRTIAGSPCR